MSRLEPILATGQPAPTEAEERHVLAGVNIVERAWFAVVNFRYAIAIIIAACVLLGLLITLLQTPEYTAKSRIQINPEKDKVTNVESLVADQPGDSLDFYQTQYSLLQTRSLAERVARQLKLSTDEQFFSMYGIDPAASEGATRAGGAKATLDSQARNKRLAIATDILLANVSIDPIRRSSLVDIQFTSPKPVFSADVANTWVSEFVQQTLDRRFESTTEARRFLEQRLAQLREKLEASERSLISYAADQQIVTLESTQDPEGRTITQRTLVSADLEGLSAELVKARADRIAAQSKLGGTSSNLAIDSNLANLRQERAKVAAERAQLLSQFEDQYPAVQEQTSRLAQIDRSIAAEQSVGRNDASEAYREARARENRLEQQVAALREGFQSQRRAGIQYQILQREVDTNRQLYDALLQRYKEIGVAGVGSNNIAVVDPAEVPRAQSKPRVSLNLFLAFVIGLFFSAVYVLIREQIDQTVKDPRQVTTALGLANLGSIPTSEAESIKEDAVDPKSEVFEAYASACTNLAFLTEHGVPRSLLITSARPNEGKSTSSFAIVNMLARQGKRVLLIDADLRNPSLDEFVGLESNLGLTHYLAGDDNIASMITRPADVNFDYLSAGKIPPNPTELLSSARLALLVKELEGRYDHLIIDGPPILGLADVPLLTSAVEGAVLIIRANSAKLRAINSAIDRIRATGAHLFGGIVTQLDYRNAAYGYGYGHGYGYGYGRNKRANEEAASAT